MTADQRACTRTVVDRTGETAAIVANLGIASFVLLEEGDRPRNYYMGGAMGSTTAMGLGVALATDHPVVVLEGDGSLVMGLGCLATVAEHAPSNFTIVVWNDGAYGTTGGQPTPATVDFAGVAEACGLVAYRADTDAEFETAFVEARQVDGPVLVEVAVDTPETAPPDAFDYARSYAKERFRTALTGSG